MWERPTPSYAGHRARRLPSTPSAPAMVSDVEPTSMRPLYLEPRARSAFLAACGGALGTLVGFAILAAVYLAFTGGDMPTAIGPHVRALAASTASKVVLPDTPDVILLRQPARTRPARHGFASHASWRPRSTNANADANANANANAHANANANANANAADALARAELAASLK